MDKQNDNETPVATFYFKLWNGATHSFAERKVTFPDPIPIVFDVPNANGVGKAHPYKCSIDVPENWKPPSKIQYQKWINNCENRVC